MPDMTTLNLAKSYANQIIGTGIKSGIFVDPNIFRFTLSDNSIINILVSNFNNYTSTEKAKLASLDTSILSKFSYVNEELLFDNAPIQGGTIDLSNYALKNGDVNNDFSANNVTVKGDIMPSANGTQDIGAPDNRFKTIYVNEAKLSTNTLYIGDTPVLGTNQDTIVIKGDVDQSVTMKTSGVGTTKVISGSGVELSTSGMNANVTIQATGSGSNANIGATNQINLNAPNINIQGTSTDIKGAMAVDSLTIRGDVTINGGATTIESTIVQVEDNIIELNKGEVGYGVTAGRSGLKIDRGDADDYLIIFDETDDSLKIGTDSALQKVAIENYVDIQDNKKADKVHNHDISDITGILPSTQLPIATSSNIGGVKAGENTTITSDGTISFNASDIGVKINDINSSTNTTYSSNKIVSLINNQGNYNTSYTYNSDGKINRYSITGDIAETVSYSYYLSGDNIGKIETETIIKNGKTLVNTFSYANGKISGVTTVTS